MDVTDYGLEGIAFISEVYMYFFSMLHVSIRNPGGGNTRGFLFYVL